MYNHSISDKSHPVRLKLKQFYSDYFRLLSGKADAPEFQVDQLESTCTHWFVN